jgi:ketosteroid isomerase-like protein
VVAKCGPVKHRLMRQRDANYGPTSETCCGRLVPVTRENVRRLFPFVTEEKGRAIAPFLFRTQDQSPYCLPRLIVQPALRVWSCETMSTSANDIQRMNGLSEDGVREIEQIHSKWIEFEVAGEDHNLMALCADDIELWPPDAQPLLGRAAVSGWMVRGTTRIHRIEITERRIRGSNEIAYLTANYKTDFSLREDSTLRQSRGSHLWILRKEAGTWVVSLVCWSSW